MSASIGHSPILRWVQPALDLQHFFPGLAGVCKLFPLLVHLGQQFERSGNIFMEAAEYLPFNGQLLLTGGNRLDRLALGSKLLRLLRIPVALLEAFLLLWRQLRRFCWLTSRRGES